MPLPLLANMEDIITATVAVVVGVVLTGSFLIRWQRMKMRFALMQAALDKGVSAFPNSPPFWLLSLRQGVMVLTLGVSLILVGGVGYWMSASVATPTAAQAGNPTAFGQPPGDEPPPPPGEDGPPDRRPPGPRGNRPDRQGPQGRPNPPMPNPAMERWHRFQQIQTVSVIAIGAGIILTLTGIVRTTFAAAERRYTEAGGKSSSEEL